MKKESDGSGYDFANVRVQRYLVVKKKEANLSTAISEYLTIGLTKSNDDVNFSAQNTKTAGKIVSIDSIMLNQSYI